MKERNDAMRKASELRASRREAPNLSTSKKIRILDMLKRGTSNRDICSTMHLRPSDIADIKKEYNLVTTNDIETRMNTLRRELHQENVENAKKTKVMNEIAPHKLPKKKEEKVEREIQKDVPDMKHVFRDRRIENIHKAVANIDEELRNWTVPSQDEKAFLRKLNLGLTYWANHYCVPRPIILKEILRLIPDFDLDSLRS